MIAKVSIRRFLWRHFSDIHSILYNDKFNKEEFEELEVLINNKYHQ